MRHSTAAGMLLAFVLVFALVLVLVFVLVFASVFVLVFVLVPSVCSNGRYDFLETASFSRPFQFRVGGTNWGVTT